MKKLLLGFGLGVLFCAAALQLARAAETSRKVVLENPRVEVTHRSIPPGGVREPYIRPTDQVIVFLNDSEYERIDAHTGERIRRTRKAGEVIWHSKGELAPRLVNAGAADFRSLIIALK